MCGIPKALCNKLVKYTEEIDCFKNFLKGDRSRSKKTHSGVHRRVQHHIHGNGNQDTFS